MRKQITITLVPLLLVTIYNQPVITITILFFIVSVINIFFRPWLGGFIDKKGERFVLMLEAILILIACSGFAFSKLLFPENIALIVVGICYLIDNLFSGAGMARTTYVKRLSDDPDEVSSTLALGISLDHILSMSTPMLAGFIWVTYIDYGYIYVFCGGLVIAVLNLLISNRIRVPKVEDVVEV